MLKSLVKYLGVFLISVAVVYQFQGHIDKLRLIPDPEFLSCIECPKWKKEVEKWKDDKKYHFKIWLYPKQKMKLY
tara:strand:+ start:258 stop:482 length:225 start_codon:yes stop_codon:yes gene_type:complete